tara:strand:- start:820 stop:1770 length:951 start_codon:yes stop_codon:yes gene_type:complete
VKKKILLVGCGNIGFRHLEGLLKTNISLDIIIIEQSNQKIIDQKKKIKKIKFINKKIYFYNNYLIKKFKFDLVICATNSYKRYDLLKKLVTKFNFSKIIIEKLAFQNIFMFEKAIQLFKKKKIKCWINCPRREQKIYKFIKKENKNNKKLFIEVVGKRWNLASNSIHFFDLFYFLNEKETYFNENEEKLRIIKSKHQNFLELTGKFSIRYGNFAIFLNDQKKSSDIIVKIKTSKMKYSINETKQIVKFYSKNKVFEKKIRIFKQSQLSKILIEKIINEEKIILPTIYEAYLSHKLLYLSFKKYFYNKGKVFNCPIT